MYNTKSDSTGKPFAEMTFKEKMREVNWVSAIFLTVTPLLSVILLPIYIYNNGWSWGLTFLLVGTYIVSNMSITVAYHRYFSHRSYDVPQWVSFLYLLVGSMAFQGTVLQWATDHRRHHREVDSHEDPYTIEKGFFYAHLGWMLMKDRHPEAGDYAKDLLKNRWIRMQHDYYVWIASFMGFIVPGLIGMACGLGFWPSVLVGGLTRIVLSQHSTFLINSAAHTFGKQPYTDKNSARDSFTMAVLTFGEGYHNYHHFFQADYRNGIRWYHWDPTKWFIRTLAVMGLAKRLKKVSADEILKARVAMEEKRIVALGASREHVQYLRERLLEAQAKWRQIQNEFTRFKDLWKKEGREALRQKRAELELARIEMNNALKAWKTYVRTWVRAQQMRTA